MAIENPHRPPAQVNRREFIGLGAALAVSAALGTPRQAAGNVNPRGSTPAANPLPAKPNFLFIITDQERSPQHWPEQWANYSTMPGRRALLDSGIQFRRAFCNTSMCTPSRATLFTGLYPARHGVIDTLTEGGTFSDSEKVLPVDLQNLAKMLGSVGYRVGYRGKWHLSKPLGDDWSSADTDAVATDYGFAGWVPPDAGQDTEPDHFGGGTANADANYFAQAQSFLQTAALDQPFALVMSLVNPHDVLAYLQISKWQAGGYTLNDLNAVNDISLPPTIDEDLTANYKPSAHAQLLTRLNSPVGLGNLNTQNEKEKYVNFYAWLQQQTDTYFTQIIDTLKARSLDDGSDESLWHNTVIVFVSDHGEMGLSHGGLRQKMFNVYEETMRVPLIISNPKLFPTGQTTDALASLIDLMPTVASLAGVDKQQWAFQGTDLWPLIDALRQGSDPQPHEQAAIHFTFDDQRSGSGSVEQAVDDPNHIRCIRTKEWKYAFYYDPAGAVAHEYEMYDLVNDPTEMQNLAHPDHPRYAEFESQRNTLHAQLVGMMTAKGTMPYNLHLPSISAG
ncbi:MAG: sulfatase-like hydrolase/transferase [Caldilineaceae bacterium]|nr:sulfatase-like hydrolase/transferase [Caldilineaceae bacterium]HRJ41262.1 sulfatase-like hydrolase/transferase [Caldilineaceae bacterium]